jgi:CRISPR/Cas system endoribonuclease Cas6 (RAMP superfamily)
MPKALWAWRTAVRSDRTLKRWYRLINRKFFYNALPNNVCVRYINEIEKEKYEDKYFAWTSNVEDMVSDGGKPGKHKYAIVISKTKNPGRTAVCASLVHEMIHVYTEMRDDHGPAFEAARQMISDRGIYKKGAILSGLTIF